MKIGARLVLAASLLLAAGPALAQFPGDTPDNVRFRLGGIFAFLNTQAELSSPDFPSAVIDFKKLLGEPDHKFAFRGEGEWNFLGRSFLDFGYVDLSTSASRSVSQDIHFDDVVYTAGAQVSSESQSRFIYADYRYGIIKNQAFQLGLSLGVSYTTLRAMLNASAGVTDPEGNVIEAGASRQAEINVPVPLLGLKFDAQIAGPVSIGAQVKAMSVTIHPYSGTMWDAEAHVDWYVISNFGLGAAYEYNKINITKTTDTKTLKFDYSYDGPRVYAIITF